MAREALAAERGVEGGAALVIVLVLLAVLTMLVVASAGTATAELVMAGNEQYHEHASDAASAGIEQAVARFRSLSPIPSSSVVSAGPTAVGASPTDTYTTATRYMGDEINLPQSSAEKLVGRHYTIASTGNSLRGATDSQTQGVLIISPASAATFGRVGAGLQGGSPP